MLLGRLWLCHAKVIHDYGNNRVQIIENGIVKTVKINQQLGFEAVTLHVLICYNSADGITNDEEATLMASDPTLHLVGIIDWSHIKTPREATPTSGPGLVDSSSLAHLEVIHTRGTISVDETPIQDKLQFMDIAHCNHNKENRLCLLNVGTLVNPKILKVNANLTLGLMSTTESLFREFLDVFVFSLEDMRGIPKHIATHRIDLDPTISPNHEARYRMNPNNAKAVKADLKQLIVGSRFHWTSRPSV